LNVIDRCTRWLACYPLTSKDSLEVRRAMEKFLQEYKHFLPSLNRVTTGYHLTFQEKKFISFENRKVRVPGDTEPVHVDMPQLLQGRTR